jgi:nitrate/nitrite-specific signal transduction histidine kinase
MQFPHHSFISGTASTKPEQYGQTSLNALANILKHARSSEVRVQFEKNEQLVQLSIRDNGQGFELPEDWLNLVRADHLGLLGMRERAEAVGDAGSHLFWRFYSSE